MLSKLKVLALISTLLATTWANAQPAPRMGISPDRYNITFDERGGETQSLLIQNMSEEPLTLSLSVSNWELDENNQIAISPPTETSLDQWIVINPLKITVPPGSPQTVRWAVMPRLKPVEGEYRAIIFIEENLPEQQQSNSTEVRMKMRYGMPIYAHVGEVVETAELHNIEVSRLGDRLSADLTNVGNKHARLSGNFGIWKKDQFPGTEEALKLLNAESEENAGEFLRAPLPPSVILPGNRRALPVDLPVDEEGEYIVQLNASFAQLEMLESYAFMHHEESEAEEVRVATLDANAPLVGAAQ